MSQGKGNDLTSGDEHVASGSQIQMFSDEEKTVMNQEMSPRVNLNEAVEAEFTDRTQVKEKDEAKEDI